MPAKAGIQYAGNSRLSKAPRRTGSSAFADDDTVHGETDYFCGCAGAVAAPPAGTAASAALVDLAGCGCASPSTAELTKRSCVGFDGFASAIGTGVFSCGNTSTTASVVTRLVSRNSLRDN